VEIARVGVEDGELILHGANDARMRMADEWDIIVDVEEGTTGVVEEILLPAANDFERVRVRDAEIFAEQGAASGEGFFERGWRKLSGRNTQDQIRVGRESEPDRTLGGKRDTGKICRVIEKIENDLEVEMSRPAAVFVGVADVCKDFASGDALASFERRERRRGKVTVKGEELDAGRGRVMKDDDGTVIEGCGIVGERVDRGIEGGGDGRARLCEEIDAKVDGATFIERIGAASKEVGRVQRARLIVTANTNGGAGGTQDRMKILRENGFGKLSGIGREEGAGYAEVEHKAVPCSQIVRDERRGGRLILSEPRFDFWRIRYGGETAGAAERVASKAGMDFGEAFKSSPGGSFGNSDIGIARYQGFAVGRIDDADGEARGQQRKEGGEFFFREWMKTMISGEDCGGRGKRIFVAESGVSSGDGRLSDGDGLVHVTEVDEGDGLAWLRPRW
jgi:hypothetical protein